MTFNNFIIHHVFGSRKSIRLVHLSALSQLVILLSQIGRERLEILITVDYLKSQANYTRDPSPHDMHGCVFFFCFSRLITVHLLQKVSVIMCYNTDFKSRSYNTDQNVSVIRSAFQTKLIAGLTLRQRAYLFGPIFQLV